MHTYVRAFLLGPRLTRQPHQAHHASPKRLTACSQHSRYFPASMLSPGLCLMTSELLHILQEQLKCLLLCDSFLDFPPGEALVTPSARSQYGSTSLEEC